MHEGLAAACPGVRGGARQAAVTAHEGTLSPALHSQQDPGTVQAGGWPRPPPNTSS